MSDEVFEVCGETMFSGSYSALVTTERPPSALELGSNPGGHHCRGRLVEVSAHEEKQALLYRQPHLRGVREICGIGDITG
jgi:hypothetical protein